MKLNVWHRAWILFSAIWCLRVLLAGGRAFWTSWRNAESMMLDAVLVPVALYAVGWGVRWVLAGSEQNRMMLR
jgi:hypothetical protein